MNILRLNSFLRESLAIEGIFRDPTEAEILASTKFLCDIDAVVSCIQVQEVYAPGNPLRTGLGMNVRVGTHIAPEGGPDIAARLCAILTADVDPWVQHCQFETLHPFMDGNGRTGRIVWARTMLRRGEDPFALPFLQRFYYQTLANSEGRKP